MPSRDSFFRPSAFIPDDRRGVALIIVIALMAIMIAVVSQLVYETRSEWMVTEVYEASLVNRVAVDSVIQRSRKRLMVHHSAESASQEQVAHHPRQGWAQSRSPENLGADRVSVVIRDESRRINLNQLAWIQAPEEGDISETETFQQISRLLQQFDLGDVHTERILRYVNDHFGTGERLKNEPLDSLRELLKLEGFDADVLFTGDEEEDAGNTPPLARFLTIYPKTPGIGNNVYNSLVNLNTAPEEVLLALSDDVTRTDARNIINWRDQTDENNEQQVFRRISHLREALGEDEENGGNNDDDDETSLSEQLWYQPGSFGGSSGGGGDEDDDGEDDDQNQDDDDDNRGRGERGDSDDQNDNGQSGGRSRGRQAPIRSNYFSVFIEVESARGTDRVRAVLRQTGNPAREPPVVEWLKQDIHRMPEMEDEMDENSGGLGTGDLR